MLARIEQGELSARLAHTVVFETVYTLQRFYRVPRPAIRDAVLPVIELPGIVLPGKTSYRQIFDWYVAFPALSFADCYHAMLERRLKLPAIVSFDRGYDRLPGVSRIEP